MLGHAHIWETVTVYRKTGIDRNGNPTYGPAIPALCSITRKTKTMRSQGGTDIQSSAQVTLPPEIIPCVQDKIMLPEGKTLMVQEVTLVTGAYGQFSHSVAWL